MLHLLSDVDDEEADSESAMRLEDYLTPVYLDDYLIAIILQEQGIYLSL